MPVTRREFLASSAAALFAPAAKAGMTLSLAAYSFRAALDLKKPTLSLFQFVDLAAELPLDAVELTSYFFAETTDDYCKGLAAHCKKKKLAVSCVPVRNDFVQKDAAKRKADAEAVVQWIARAKLCGAKTVRVFAGNLPKGEELAAGRDRCVGHLKEVAAEAAKAGMVLALENHGGITGTPDGLIALVKAVDSPALRVNADTGNFRTADPYADLAKVVPYAVNVQVKTDVFPNGGKEVEADLPKVMKILKDGGYTGPVALEYEGAFDPEQAVPKYVKELRALMG